MFLNQVADIFMGFGDVANAFGMGNIAMCTKANDVAIGTASLSHTAYKIADGDGCNFSGWNSKRIGIVATRAKRQGNIHALPEVGLISNTRYITPYDH